MSMSENSKYRTFLNQNNSSAETVAKQGKQDIILRNYYVVEASRVI